MDFEVPTKTLVRAGIAGSIVNALSMAGLTMMIGKEIGNTNTNIALLVGGFGGAVSHVISNTFASSSISRVEREARKQLSGGGVGYTGGY